MTRSRWFLLVASVVLAIAAAGAWLMLRPADDAQSPSGVAVGSDTANATAEAAAATAEQAVAQLDVMLKIKMPPDFDDGIRRREIVGEGVADFDRNVGSVDYGMDEVPNSAGFFGHVSGDMSVVYEGSRFIVTFPVMADVLEGELDWMSYEVSDFSDPRVLSAGIGQLREIGLADPRIGFGLAASGVGGEPDAEGRVAVDLAQAEGAVGADLQPTLQELQELGVDQVMLATEIDEDGALRSYSYELSYPPGGAGGRKARLSVTIEVGQTGLDDSIEVPPEPAVQRYRDYLET